MNIVDSSGWLEYLADGKNADFFATPISDAVNLVTHRGRTTRYRAAPAQIPASGITAPGFSKVLTTAGIRAGEQKTSTL